MLRHACGYALANKGMTPEPCRLTPAIRTSSVSNRTKSESYGGVTRSLAARLRFPYVLHVMGVEDKTHVQ